MIELKPFIQTDDSRCGPATLKIVLDYYGISATEDELCIKCRHSYQNGCKNDDMEKVLESYGLKTYSKVNATIKDIEYWIEKRIPVIVDWFSTGVTVQDKDCADGHASIVVDIDDTHIYILDPEHGKIRKILQKDFMRVWFDWEDTNEIQPWTKMNIRYMLVAMPE